MRHAARVDVNQAEIVAALRKCGFQVEIIGKPVDLLVSKDTKRTFIMEVKNPERERGGSGLTKDQVEFIARWPGEYHIVETVQQAIVAALGKEAMR